MKCIPTTLSGRFVTAPSFVIEIEEVFEARIVSGGVMRSRVSKTSVADVQNKNGREGRARNHLM